MEKELATKAVTAAVPAKPKVAFLLLPTGIQPPPVTCWPASSGGLLFWPDVDWTTTRNSAEEPFIPGSR